MGLEDIIYAYYGLGLQINMFNFIVDSHNLRWYTIASSMTKLIVA